jgi:hypothetical protein
MCQAPYLTQSKYMHNVGMPAATVTTLQVVHLWVGRSLAQGSISTARTATSQATSWAARVLISLVTSPCTGAQCRWGGSGCRLATAN